MWKIIQVSPEEWKSAASRLAHSMVFGQQLYNERIDYALVAARGEEFVGYVTVKENDADNVYWQFGGVIPHFQKSIVVSKALKELLDWQKQHSKRILSYVENSNLSMLRLFLSSGFLIVGTRTSQGKI